MIPIYNAIRFLVSLAFTNFQGLGNAKVQCGDTLYPCIFLRQNERESWKSIIR